jgi:hypothetical protein
VSETMRQMQHLWGHFWYAAPGVFLKPGVYYRSTRILSLPSKNDAPSMVLVEFPEQTIVVAKDQPEYLPLPAYRHANDAQGRLVCCWRIGWKHRFRLLFTGTVWHQVLTFNQPLQPQLLSVEKPEMSKP